MAEKFVNMRIIKLTFEMHNVSGPGNPVACSSSSICDDHHHDYDNRDDYDQNDWAIKTMALVDNDDDGDERDNDDDVNDNDGTEGW